MQEAREAIASYDARQRTDAPQDESINAIEARFIEAQSSGRLAQAVRTAVMGQRQSNPSTHRRAA